MAGNVGRTYILVASSNRLLDFVLAACDVEGNFIVVKAYQYTNLLSCMLLNSWVLSLDQNSRFLTSLSNRWAIPSCLFFSWLFMRTKYTWTQLAVCEQADVKF